MGGAAHERCASQNYIIGARLVVRHGDLLHDHHEVGEILHHVLWNHLEGTWHLLWQGQRHLQASHVRLLCVCQGLGAARKLGENDSFKGEQQADKRRERLLVVWRLQTDGACLPAFSRFARKGRTSGVFLPSTFSDCQQTQPKPLFHTLPRRQVSSKQREGERRQGTWEAVEPVAVKMSHADVNWHHCCRRLIIYLSSSEHRRPRYDAFTWLTCTSTPSLIHNESLQPRLARSTATPPSWREHHSCMD